MRSSARRTDKYSKKLRALVLPGQTARYVPTAADRLHLEFCVKKEAITPMLQFSYVAFCEELIKHEANKRPEEGLGIYNKWLNRGLDATTLQSVASCIGVSIEIPAPPVCDWSWKRKLTFTGNVSATNLDDFPILVHLTNANFDFAKAKDNGEDLRFMDSDTCPSDGTPLKHEIELWDKVGENAWVWVKVPRINGGTVNDFIYMFYGNAAAADGQDAVNVWTNGYIAVVHLRGDGTINLPDSLGVYNFTKRAIGEPANITGKVDGAQLFDGINDYIKQLTLLDTMPAALVISFWFKPTSGWTSAQPVDEYFFDKTNTANNIIFMIAKQDTGQFMSYNNVGGVLTTLRTIKNTWLAQFYHLSWHYGTGGMKIYVDGTLDNSNVNATVPGPGSDWDLFLCSSRGTWEFTHCSMDEFRVSNVTRSTDWVHAQWKSQDETLITFGAEQPA